MVKCEIRVSTQTASLHLFLHLFGGSRAWGAPLVTIAMVLTPVDTVWESAPELPQMLPKMAYGIPSQGLRLHLFCQITPEKVKFHISLLHYCTSSENVCPCNDGQTHAKVQK